MAEMVSRFEDRADAGRRLAQVLVERRLEDPIVYALPRGGVPVAVEVAKALHAPLDLLMVRKIGAPGSPELALAAVVDGHDAQTVVNEEVKAITGADETYLETARARELAEIERRRRVYFDGHGRLSPEGHTAIVIDDGLATGATAKAALHALKRQGARRTVLAVPVAPVRTLEEMREEADEVVCLNPSERFWGVGGFYDDFHQLDDAEALASLAEVWSLGDPPAPKAAALLQGRSPAERLRRAVEPLPAVQDAAFAAAFDRFAAARVVLLGEASHGTSEFYRARAAISRRLIERHGFDFVALEADWPDAAAVDRHVRLKPHRPMDVAPFSRFPTWMWRNRDFDGFVRWLRAHNGERTAERRAGFYGLDLYNMRAAMAAVLAYLDEVDPETAAEARERYACLSPWSARPAAYGRAALTRGYAMCEEPVMDMLRDLVGKRLAYAAQDGELFFDAAQNARLVADAERYYRAMYRGADASWNLRDRHMFETLEHVLERRGPQSKAVVWAHNSHIGDARFTDMGLERGELNLGQLCRERFGGAAALIGFGTHAGSVMAACDWDEPGEVVTVRPARPDSYEALCHETGQARFLLDLRPGEHEAVRDDLRPPRLERYIGVVYRPQSELTSHYARSILPEQYDAFVWFDETSAVTPLPTEFEAVPVEDETYPFGL